MRALNLQNSRGVYVIHFFTWVKEKEDLIEGNWEEVRTVTKEIKGSDLGISETTDKEE